MSTETILRPPLALPPADDPYYYGWRYEKRTDEHGNIRHEMVPLTAWDVLHPQEDDHFVITPAHDRDCTYLKITFQGALAGRPDSIVFQDMRLDLQAGENSVFGPDVSVFEQLSAPVILQRGTFYVKDMGARPVVFVEVVSPSTELIDKKDKVVEYARFGVPLYVLVDREGEGSESVVEVYGYRLTAKGYVRLPEHPKGVWVESLQLWIGPAGDRVACFDKQGNRVPDTSEIVQERDTYRKERDEEKQRAEQEKQRAEQEKQRAERERQLREAAEQQAALARQTAEQERRSAAEMVRKLANMEAELRRLRGEPN